MNRTFFYRPFSLSKAAVKYDRIYPLAAPHAVTLRDYNIDSEDPVWPDVSPEVPRERYSPPNACIRTTPKSCSLFTPASASDALSGLAIEDARVRRRVKSLLNLTSETREFSHAEVSAYCGHVTNRNSRLLRLLFIELPYFPSRTLGEVKMYQLDELIRLELIRLVKLVDRDWTEICGQ